MSAEFYVTFGDLDWYKSNKGLIEERLSSLSTFCNKEDLTEFWLAGTEPRHVKCWEYDVRLFLERESVFLEISSHPPSVEVDLRIFFSWLREHTETYVNDEDGEASNW
jgi:hypothetical protein